MSNEAVYRTAPATPGLLNTSLRSMEFPRAHLEGTPNIECWYFPELPNSSQGTDIILFLNVMKLHP